MVLPENTIGFGPIDAAAAAIHIDRPIMSANTIQFPRTSNQSENIHTQHIAIIVYTF